MLLFNTSCFVAFFFILQNSMNVFLFQLIFFYGMIFNSHVIFHCMSENGIYIYIYKYIIITPL